MAEIVLNVEIRERTGTGGARAARRDAKVPGILYGGALGPVALSTNANAFRKALYTGKLLGHLITLKYGDETQSVIAKDVQLHPVTDEPVHFDLYRVDEHQLIRISVPVHFKHHDASPGLKQGGTLNVVRHEIELLVPADHIPEDVVVDLAGLEIGARISVANLKLAEGVQVNHAERDFVIATIAATAASNAGEGAA